MHLYVHEITWPPGKQQSKNRAIRDGKYLAQPHTSVDMLIFFRDVISLLARVFIFVIDMATRKVSHEKYCKEIIGPVFEICTPLNCRCLLTRHDVTYVHYRSTLTYREYYTNDCNVMIH